MYELSVNVKDIYSDNNVYYYDKTAKSANDSSKVW